MAHIFQSSYHLKAFELVLPSAWDTLCVDYHMTFAVSASQIVLMVKNPPANAGDARDAGSIPGLGRSLGEGNGNPLQNSFLENSMDRGVWQAVVHGASESQS